MIKQVTVKAVNQPDKFPRIGSLWLADGSYVNILKEHLGLYKEGCTYSVDIKTQGKDGSTRKPYADDPPTLVESAPVTNGGMRTVKPVDDKTAERIYVCGLLNAFAQGGQLQLTQEAITQATRYCRASWGETFGNPQKRDDMSDEIPW